MPETIGGTIVEFDVRGAILGSKGDCLSAQDEIDVTSRNKDNECKPRENMTRLDR